MTQAGVQNTRCGGWQSRKFGSELLGLHPWRGDCDYINGVMQRFQKVLLEQ